MTPASRPAASPAHSPGGQSSPCLRARAARRLAAALVLSLAGLASIPVFAQQPATSEGVQVGKPSAVARLVPAEQLERMAGEQYAQMMREAAGKGALLPPDHPQVQRSRRIARAVIAHAQRFNPRAAQWRWEVNVIASPQINAFCMPGGKIGIYTGIVEKLRLTDDELAMVIGHEVAHALREHARERMAKGNLTEIGAGLVTSLLGLGDAFVAVTVTTCPFVKAVVVKVFEALF